MILTNNCIIIIYNIIIIVLFGPWPTMHLAVAQQKTNFFFRVQVKKQEDRNGKLQGHLAMFREILVTMFKDVPLPGKCMYLHLSFKASSLLYVC